MKTEEKFGSIKKTINKYGKNVLLSLMVVFLFVGLSYDVSAAEGIRSCSDLQDLSQLEMTVTSSWAPLMVKATP